MSVLIVKLDATGDVVRTTPLLARFGGDVTWLTSPRNTVLLETLPGVRCVPWPDRDRAADRRYDLVVSLEDDAAPAAFARSVDHERLWGAYLDDDGVVRYTADAAVWFDLSLISTHGRTRADRLKFENRRSYQDLVFEGLGWHFVDEPYALPAPSTTDLRGDVAIAPLAGPVWPMKGWDGYASLQLELERRGFRVNVLPHRPSLLEHLGDIRNHRVIVCGDSLPMHLAVGLGCSCVALFNCTSPWEIHDYGRLHKVISPRLDEFFYKRGLDPSATRAISLDSVLDRVLACLGNR